MNTSDLNDTLNGNISGKRLAEKIFYEVEEYKLKLKKTGSTIPLYFNEDKEIMLSRSSIKKLLNETLEGNLGSAHLAYIADCLTLGEKVNYEYENLREIIFDIADPEINGGFRKPDEILVYLSKIG